MPDMSFTTTFAGIRVHLSSAPGASIALAQRRSAAAFRFRSCSGQTQDEKMYRVVMDRERWFQVVMGEDYRLDLESTEKLAERVPFPEPAARALVFDLSV